jgi:carboxylesterase
MAAAGLLGLHGFGGLPADLALFQRAAAPLGYRMVLPLLPGHGTSPLDLLGCTWDVWYQAAEAALLRDSERDGPLVVGGVSMGAVLAVQLAVSHAQRVRGLVLLAPALWLRLPHPTWLLSAVQLLGVKDRLVSKKHGPDLRDLEARRANRGYREQPLHGAVEVYQAGRAVRARLGEVHCPVLVMQGARDRVVHPSCPWRIASRVGTAQTRVVMLPSSGHLLGEDVDRQQAQSELNRWLQELSG